MEKCPISDKEQPITTRPECIALPRWCIVLWWVVCAKHGRIPLSEHDYIDQMRKAFQPWYCPRCEAPAPFDDSAYQALWGQPFHWKHKGEPGYERL